MLAARLLTRRACVSSTRHLLRGSRCISSSASLFNANPFLMPAMSPTMEKGGIVSWKVKEGDSFNAGDVLLEVETDKAQIDVEAQDDGKMAKIIFKDGSKDVSVGDVIAFTAEPEDDLSSLEIPEVSDSMKKTSSSPSETKASEGASAAPVQTESKSTKAETKKLVASEGALAKADPEQTLLPSVIMALADNGISKSEALDKIKASGHNGRILKGDVLAYAGKISQDSVVRIAEFIKKGEKLDLSNIEKVELSEDKSAEATKSGSDTATAAATEKLEPLQLHEEVMFEIDGNTDITRVERSVRNYIDEIYQYTHDTPLANTASDRYDPFFEDLLTVEPRAPRFDVEYCITQLNDTPESQQEDIFDLLSTKDRNTSNNQTNVYSLEVTVTVNEEYTDSLAKSERFLECLRELST